MSITNFPIHRRLILTAGLCAATAIVAADLMYTSLHGSRIASAQPNASYTVTLDQTSTKNGQARHANTSLYAVRADGSSMSRITSSPYAPQPDVFRTLRLASGNMVQIRDLKALTLTTTNSMPTQLRRLSNQCALGNTEAYAGEEVVEGYPSIKLTQAGRTSWYVRDYGCALVRERWVLPDGSVNEKKLVSLIAGEPDAALFHIPPGYREVTASEWQNPTATAGPLSTTP